MSITATIVSLSGFVQAISCARMREGMLILDRHGSRRCYCWSHRRMVGFQYRWSRRDSSPIIEGMGWFDLASNCTSILIHKSWRRLMGQVGNAAEHFTAVSVSVKDKIDLSISVAVGSSIQIALFVIPVIQLLAWCISKPLTLMFDRMSFIPPTLTLLS